MARAANTFDDEELFRELFDGVSGDGGRSGGGVVADPYPDFHRARERGAVHAASVPEVLGLDERVPYQLRNYQLRDRGIPVYSAWSFEACDRALRDAATFSSELYQRDTVVLFGPNILAMGGDEHRRHRALVQPSFTRARTDWWSQNWIAGLVDGLLARIEDGGRAELNLDVCARLPLLVITASFGIPAESAVAVRAALSRMLFRPDLGMDERLAASKEIGDLLQPAIDARRARPGEFDDLLAVVVEAEIAEPDGTRARLGDEDVLGFSRLLLAAGSGTTWRQLGITLHALLSQPDALAAVRDDPALLRNAVEESVRWDVTDPIFRRFTTRDVDLCGTHIPAGSVVELVLGAANRDPSRWDRPDDYVLDRPLQPHLGFATGPHVCLGIHVARAEMSVALGAILERLPGLRWDPDVERPDIIGLEHRGPTSLPVRFGV
jgi:cytochrome P450